MTQQCQLVPCMHACVLIKLVSLHVSADPGHFQLVRTLFYVVGVLLKVLYGFATGTFCGLCLHCGILGCNRCCCNLHSI